MNTGTARNKKLINKLLVSFICSFAVAIFLTNLFFPQSRNVPEIGVSVSIIGMLIFFPACIAIVITPLKKLKDNLNELSTGKTEQAWEPGSYDEIGAITELLGVILPDLNNRVAIAESLQTGLMSPLMLTNKEGVVTFINKPAAVYLSFSVEEVTNKKTVVDIFGSDKATKSTLAGKPVYNHVSNGHDRNGKELKALVNTSLLKDAKGQPAGVAIFVLDLKEEEAKQKEMILQQSHSIAIALQAMAKGDLTVKVELDNNSYLHELAVDLETSIRELRNTLEHVQESVAATASASNQISSSTEEMAAGAQEQSAQTSEVASAVEEMTKTILETSRNSARAAAAAKNSGEIAKVGGKVVEETIQGMNRVADVVKRSAETVQALGKSSDQIGEIVQVIDDIADQTNLLALNAAIEAARAGEQGRGFAVVADEVRKLAERTTKATKEIAEMIRQIQKDTVNAVQSMEEGTEEVEKGKAMADKAGKSLSEIITGAEEVVDMVTMVAAASEEQSSAAEQISKNIESISNVTNESAAGIQQIARASEDLNKLTFNLQEMIAKFKINDESRERGLVTRRN